MLELLADHGYGGITVRALAQLAGVSTKAFYEHFSNKEECFLYVHEQTVRKVLRRMESAEGGSLPIEDRQAKRAVEALLDEWARDPLAARLMLIDALVGSPRMMKQARWGIRSIQTKLRQSFDAGMGQGALPPAISEGIVGGLEHMGRSWLLESRQPTGPDTNELCNDLVGWALACCKVQSTQIQALAASTSLSTPPSRVAAQRVAAANGEHAAVLSAICKIASNEGPAGLTLERVLEVAGLSRRSFSANFSDLSSGIVAALDQRIDDAIMCAGDAMKGELRTIRALHRLVGVLGFYLASDKALIGLCAGEAPITGMQKALLQLGIVRRITELVSQWIPAGFTVDPFTLEVSVGGLWTVLEALFSACSRREYTLTHRNTFRLILLPMIEAGRATSAASTNHASALTA